MNAPKSLLPIDCLNGCVLDHDKAFEIGKNLMEEYSRPEASPHIVIDNVLPEGLAEKLLNHFPAEAKINDKIYQKGYGGFRKRQIRPCDCDEVVRNAFSFFNSASMLKLLEGMTNIPGLLPDPYFTGGGLHETSAGGLLGIHADLRVNEGLQLLRRINVLIYLNKEWQDTYGGMLELWDKEVKAKIKSVSALFNRCVIFNTDVDSFHGHPTPLKTPKGITRKSIALYYYTAMEIKNDSGESRHTRYVARPNDSRKIRVEVRKLAKKRERRAKRRLDRSEAKTVKQILASIKERFLSGLK